MAGPFGRSGKLPESNVVPPPITSSTPSSRPNSNPNSNSNSPTKNRSTRNATNPKSSKVIDEEWYYGSDDEILKGEVSEGEVERDELELRISQMREQLIRKNQHLIPSEFSKDDTPWLRELKPDEAQTKRTWGWESAVTKIQNKSVSKSSSPTNFPNQITDQTDPAIISDSNTNLNPNPNPVPPRLVHSLLQMSTAEAPKSRRPPRHNTQDSNNAAAIAYLAFNHSDSDLSDNDNDNNNNNNKINNMNVDRPMVVKKKLQGQFAENPPPMILQSAVAAHPKHNSNKTQNGFNSDLSFGYNTSVYDASNGSKNPNSNYQGGCITCGLDTDHKHMLLCSTIYHPEESKKQYEKGGADNVAHPCPSEYHAYCLTWPR